MIWHIRERSVFSRLSQQGRRSRAGVLWCTHILDSSAEPPQVAFAIGRAVGPAVVRNQLRRRLRVLLVASSARPNDPSLPSLPRLAGGWYLIGVRPEGAKCTFTELQFDLETLLRRIHGSSTP